MEFRRSGAKVHNRRWLVAFCLMAFIAAQEAAAAAGTSNLPEAAVTGKATGELAGLDAMMQSFVQTHKIPGAALAVAKDGRLVYARGFGLADVEKREPVQPDSLFRIASVSKPITAVAILRLVDEKKLRLDDRVFEPLPNETPMAGGETIDPRLKNITVRHLLQHRGGWDRAVSIDPMFYSVEIASVLGKRPPSSPLDVIRFMRGWPLDFDPGARYAYSNFGYCFLGRVIEQATGEQYETHVREHLLASLGITRMRIGKTLPGKRAGGEVRYYTQEDVTGFSVFAESLGRNVPRPYGSWYLEAMDAHGGWIASAVDLVRFASRVAGGDQRSLLSPQCRAAMIACPPGDAGHRANGEPKETYYGLGWNVRPKGHDGKANLWHAGAFSGTSTLLVIRHDGFCWAALFNISKTKDGKRPANVIDPEIHTVIDSVRQWPSHDLFKDYLQ